MPVATDHGDDDQIGALFERVRADHGRLDVLVNNVYKIPDPPAWGGGFWDHPLSVWDDQVGIGLRAHYVASWHAAPLLFAAGPGGAIVNVSSPGGQSYLYSSSYGAGKAGLDRLSADMAIELRAQGHRLLRGLPGQRGDRVHHVVGGRAGHATSAPPRPRSASGGRSPRWSPRRT